MRRVSMWNVIWYEGVDKWITCLGPYYYSLSSHVKTSGEHVYMALATPMCFLFFFCYQILSLSLPLWVCVPLEDSQPASQPIIPLAAAGSVFAAEIFRCTNWKWGSINGCHCNAISQYCPFSIITLICTS